MLLKIIEDRENPLAVGYVDPNDVGYVGVNNGIPFMILKSGSVINFEKTVDIEKLVISINNAKKYEKLPKHIN